MIHTMSQDRWIDIQQKIIHTEDWYLHSGLPRILRNIGDATLLDLEFNSEQDYTWFMLRWS